jgi:serine/threonine protein kinase
LLVLDNPNILRAHGLYDLKISDQPGLGMLVDYKADSDLSTWIPDGGLSEWAFKGIVTQLRDALLYLHRRSIVHRDIKPSNVFCARGEHNAVKVCLGDFGLAAYAAERDRISTRCGSPGFIAPEIFGAAWTEMLSSPPEDAQGATEQILKTDIFSFGMLIHATTFGENPFIGPTQEQTYMNNARGIIETDEASAITVELQDVLKWCTARNPSERCSIFDIADHSWFQGDLRALGFAGADDDIHGDSVSWAVFEAESARRRD